MGKETGGCAAARLRGEDLKWGQCHWGPDARMVGQREVVSRGAPPRPGCIASERRLKVSPGPQLVWGGIIGVSCVHHDMRLHRNDVQGKIGDKRDVMGAEVVHQSILSESGHAMAETSRPALSK
jgi:hypothetical protein